MVGEQANLPYSAQRIRRRSWSSTSPALEKQALIWVAGIVTPNPSEAVREKKLKKHCRKVIVFLHWMQRVKYFFSGNLILPQSATC